MYEALSGEPGQLPMWYYHLQAESGLGPTSFLSAPKLTTLMKDWEAHLQRQRSERLLGGAFTTVAEKNGNVHYTCLYISWTPCLKFFKNEREPMITVLSLPAQTMTSGATISFSSSCLPVLFCFLLLPLCPPSSELLFSKASIFTSLQHTQVWADMRFCSPQGGTVQSRRENQMYPPLSAKGLCTCVYGSWLNQSQGHTGSWPFTEREGNGYWGPVSVHSKEPSVTTFFIPVLLGPLNTTRGYKKNSSLFKKTKL